ncbi:endonuclease V [Clostridium felsineum]|uniref:endonuclease V n=1 Tax=Clostridium felsineum TaxID=36839 RepID=UPI0009C78E16|nr:endonuclease V [Clostridium felsineum]URZ04065.1 Endonuclease V [Clostridium felsineum]
MLLISKELREKRKENFNKEDIINSYDFKNIKTEKEAAEVQLKLNEFIEIDKKLKIEKIKKVAGVDLAYWKKEDVEYAVCCIVVIDYSTKEVVEKVEYVGEIKFPYIPGCLAFRELSLVLEAVKKLNLDPDLYVFDGNGYLHPRHMGIATHAGIYLNKPTIGVAKSYYKIADTDFVEPENSEGAYTDIVIDKEVYGRALRTQKNVKPIFISIGNYIDLETSTKIINKLLNKQSHIPIPTRLADIETHKMRTLYR